MTDKIERTDAEIMYANAIVERGNPHYFIHRVIDGWDTEYLESRMATMGLDFEIYEEEE